MINWKNCKPLTTAEMEITARAASKGDRQAIEKLVQSNVKLASSLAHQYSDFQGLQVEDLTSEAMIGLIESIPRFDPERGTKFTTFAAWRMRKHVLDHVMHNFRLVKIGTTQAQKKIFWRLNREVKALQKAGIDVDDQALATRLDVKEQEISDMRIRMHSGETSLDAPVKTQGAEGEAASSVLDTLDSNTPTPEQYATKARMTSWVQDRMVEFEQRLQGSELAVWNHRIASEDPATLQDVGDKIGTSRQYVNQTEKRLTVAFTEYARNHKR